MLVFSRAAKGRPAVRTRRAPDGSPRRSRASSRTRTAASSKSAPKSGRSTGSIPQTRFSRRCTPGSIVTATSGRRGRKRASARADAPLCVKQTIAAASQASAACTAPRAVASAIVGGSSRSGRMDGRAAAYSSAARTMRRMVRTVSAGKRPIAVSPDSITASVPSRTAFATSLASARVGSGLAVIDSSICVAVMTGVPCRRQVSMMRFCSTGTVSIGHSTPRSPRATMTASAALTTASSSSTACRFSIFAITRALPARAVMPSRSSVTSAAARTNDSPT